MPAAPRTGETTIHDLLPVVAARGAGYVSDAGTITAELLASHRHAYSDVHRVRLIGPTAPPMTVVIKIFSGADRQFRAMQAVWPDFATHPTLRIARPLDCLDEGRALVMEAVAGQSLQATLPRLAWPHHRIRAAAAACERAGEWLRFYHGLEPAMAAAPLDVAQKWHGFAESLARLERDGLDRRVCRRFAEALRPLVAGLDGQPRPCARLHGEFTVDNVLVDGHRVTVLDLWGEFHGAVDHDLASFLNSLLLLRLSRRVPPAVLDHLRGAFLRGYRGGAAGDETALLFLQGLGLIDAAIEILGRRRSFLARTWVERVVTGAMAQIGDRAGREQP